MNARVIAGDKPGIAADMIGVMVGSQDGRQIQAVFFEKRDAGRRIAGVNQHGMAFIVQCPDIIVPESGNGSNSQHGVGANMKDSIISPEWFASPLGAYLLEREQSYYDRAVADIFGFYAVQIGLSGFDFLRNSRIPGRIHCGQNTPAQVLAEPMFLPFESQSMDLLVMPHVLEYTGHPHQVLRETERVLRPEGRLILSGFNPRSLWGLARILKGHEKGFPWNGQFLNMPRVKDWLALLGFELAAGSMCCYRLPVNQENWLKRFRFMEPAGDRWWAMGGGVYFLQAVKRVHGMRVLTPAWKTPAAAKASPSLAARKILDLAHYRTKRGKR